MYACQQSVFLTLKKHHSKARKTNQPTIFVSLLKLSCLRFESKLRIHLAKFLFVFEGKDNTQATTMEKCKQLQCTLFLCLLLHSYLTCRAIYVRCFINRKSNQKDAAVLVSSTGDLWEVCRNITAKIVWHQRWRDNK